MFKRFAPVMLLGALLLSLPGQAAAEMQTVDEAKKALEDANRKKQRLKRIEDYKTRFRKTSKPVTKPTTGKVQVPELDPNAAGSSLALVVGGLLVLVDRRKRNVLIG